MVGDIKIKGKRRKSMNNHLDGWGRNEIPR